MKSPQYVIRATGTTRTLTARKWNSALAKARTLIPDLLNPGESAQFVEVQDRLMLDTWTTQSGRAMFTTSTGRTLEVWITLDPAEQ